MSNKGLPGARGPGPAPALSAEAYAHCFLTFRQHSTEWLAMLRWCREQLVARLPVKSPFSVLSVGAGNGDFDWRLIAILQTQLQNLAYVMVEPNDILAAGLRERLRRHVFTGVSFEIDPVSCENFAIRRPFDLIHFTHCLYYIPDRQGAIEHALHAVKADGEVLIFHQTDLGIDQVQQRFIRRIKGDDREMFCSADLEAILTKAQIPYRLEVVESQINVSECFRPGSAVGEELLSFFLESDVRGLAPALKQEVLDYLYDITYVHLGRRLLHHPVAIFTLGRPGG